MLMMALKRLILKKAWELLFEPVNHKYLEMMFKNEMFEYVIPKKFLSGAVPSFWEKD